MRGLVTAAGPWIEQLFGLIAVLRRRPDLPRIRSAILRDCGAATPPPAPPAIPERFGTPQRRLLPTPGPNVEPAVTVSVGAVEDGEE